MQTGLKMCETRISADNFTVCDRLAILMNIFAYGSCFKIGPFTSCQICKLYQRGCALDACAPRLPVSSILLLKCFINISQIYFCNFGKTKVGSVNVCLGNDSTWETGLVPAAQTLCSQTTPKPHFFY